MSLVDTPNQGVIRLGGNQDFVRANRQGHGQEGVHIPPLNVKQFIYKQERVTMNSLLLVPRSHGSSIHIIVNRSGMEVFREKSLVILSMQTVELDKLGGQGGSKVSTMQGNTRVVLRVSCSEVELLNKDREVNVWRQKRVVKSNICMEARLLTHVGFMKQGLVKSDKQDKMTVFMISREVQLVIRESIVVLVLLSSDMGLSRQRKFRQVTQMSVFTS